MSEIACRTARLWLQEPRDLDPARAELLDRHLDQCFSCRETRTRHLELDRRVEEYVRVASVAESVRSEVQRRLLERQQARSHASRAGRWLGWRPVWIAAPLVVVLSVAALVAPQTIPGGGGRLPTPALAWRVPRMGGGFAIAVDPTRPDHLLAGAWGQVYESWNAGNSWRPLGPLPPRLVVRALAVDAREPNRYLVATKHSVFVSSDRGRHWTKTADSLPGATDMFLLPDPRSAGTFYLGPSVLWKSVDHGQTWFMPGSGTVFAPYGIQALTVAGDGALWTGIWGRGVALSTDGGRRWVRRALGLARNVLDVAVESGRLWAATDQGLYVSRDAGLHWSHVPLPGHFFATNVLAEPGYVLVGGHGMLYRYDDSQSGPSSRGPIHRPGRGPIYRPATGRRLEAPRAGRPLGPGTLWVSARPARGASAAAGQGWYPSVNGLPLDPYVYQLVADPSHPERVFASLDSDGVFRSDDGGQHWEAIDTGLPSTRAAVHISLLLFRRYGALWITDTRGTDPGVLTVDTDVQLASLSPDGAAAAYLAVQSDRWAVRVVSSGGGSGARTLATGRGDVPQQLLWSPNASLLAIVSAHSVVVTNLGHTLRSWALHSDERVLGWSADGRALLIWNRDTRRVSAHLWSNGRARSQLPGLYPVQPLAAPDGRHMAFIWKNYLHTGVWSAGPEHTASPSDRNTVACRLRAWSDASTRLLLACGDRVEARSAAGQLVAGRGIAAATWVSWAPGSDRNLLVFRQGNLWAWPLSSPRPREIVGRAEPLLAHLPGVS